MTGEKKREYTLRIAQANKSQMVVIIYEMLKDYIEDARECLGEADAEGFHESIRRCTGCVRELTSSINMESDVSTNLMSLYIYCMRELSMADLHHSAEELYHVEIVINKLYAVSKQVAEADDSPAIMKNTPLVYAGLTYGKESLVVNLNNNMNRGYTV